MPRTGAAASVLIHLRLPFFFFLSPIFLFALAASPAEPWRAAAVFAIFHFLLYPASNGFNSYFDRDEGPIGGIAAPPPVHRALLWTALALDALALAAGFALGWVTGLGALLYGTGSKLYSWDGTRLKARPVAGWLTVGIGQGALSFLAMAASVGAGGLADLGPAAWACAPLQSIFLLGVYPLTQVYQHEEDERRGDMTISRRLGVRGTFVLSGTFLALSGTLIAAWLAAFASAAWAIAFVASQIPTLAVFLSWARRCFADPASAGFRGAMVMNTVASGALNVFLALFLILR